MNINQVRKTLDNRNVPYQDPLCDTHQIILRGTADIIEGDYNNDGTWTIFIRAANEKESSIHSFETPEKLIEHLNSHYKQQPYDMFSAAPLLSFEDC